MLFRSQGIQTSVHYPAAHHFTTYKELGAILPQTDYCTDNEVTLPMYAALTMEQVDFICEVVANGIKEIVSKQKYIYSVEDEFNGVVIKGLFYYKQFMFGQGAGGFPTGSAVLSDITAQLYDYRYQYKKLQSQHQLHFTNDYKVRIYYRYDSPATLNLLEFSTIHESYYSDTYKYVVGDIELSQLQAQAQSLRESNVFVCLYPED